MKRIMMVLLVFAVLVWLTSPSKVQALEVKYQLYGLDFGPYVKSGQNPEKGTVVPPEQVEQLLGVVSPYTQWIRTYGCGGGLNATTSLAHQKGLKVAAGIWLGSDLAANENEIACLINSERPEVVVVGSEVLHRGDLSPAQLVEYLNRMRSSLPGVIVVTADVYSEFLEHPEVAAASDELWVNYHPFWAEVKESQAVAWVETQHRQMLGFAAPLGKQVVISETGWPSYGYQVGKAIPSQSNAARFFVNFVSWARATNTRYFYFEAFDEPWKWKSNMPQEAYWGIWSRYGYLKPNMVRVFRGETIPDNWSPTPTPTPQPTAIPTATPVPPGPPAVEFTYVPPYGSYDRLRGRVVNIPNPQDYGIAVYIQVRGGWWTKPFWPTVENPFWHVTKIAADGTWVCSIVTGGVDWEAKTIVAFLIPGGYNPPTASGGSLPISLDSFPYAIAYR